MKRKINNQISEAIPILHKILLMVENDEVSFAYGCNWSSVKQNATTVNINNKDNQVIIESSNGEILKMKKGKRIASDFLKHFRNAFAHNYITYNSQTNALRVNLKSCGKKSYHMKGEISLSALQEIVDLIKNSKIKK